jgi:hypothetical protein
VTQRGRAVTASTLQPGAIISADFASAAGKRLLRDVKILAAPGAEFTFFGQVTHLDLRSGVLALENRSDGKLYEVRFAPEQFNEQVKMGSDVAVIARFDGRDYVAQRLTVQSARSADADEEAESKTDRPKR